MTHGADLCLWRPPPPPSGNGKSWSVVVVFIFSPPAHQRLEMPMLVKDCYSVRSNGLRGKRLALLLSFALIVVQNGRLGFLNVTQWKLPLRAATVGFSSFWDSWAVISTGRFVNLLVLLCACRPNCQSLAASFTVMPWATVVHCVIQTEAYFSALCLIKVLSEAFAVAGWGWVGGECGLWIRERASMCSHAIKSRVWWWMWNLFYHSFVKAFGTLCC